MLHLQIRSIFLLLPFALLSIACGNYPTEGDSIPGLRGQISANLSAAPANAWMGALYDNVLVSQISIPGTHDSGARFEPFPGTAKCQNLTISQQLEAGIRFLDIRTRHIDNAFAIHHGSIYQNMNFDDVLNAVIGFMNANPTETVILSVKEEHTSANVSRSFEQTFDAYVAKNPTRWLLDAAIPYLGAARGKIVLLRRFGATSLPKGIDASSWADNTTFSSGNLRVQDNYVVGNNTTKWNAIVALFNEAVGGSSTTLFINFTSGYKPGWFGIPSITTVSNAINPQIATYFGSHTSGHYGIIPMDFADANRAALIFKTN